MDEVHHVNSPSSPANDTSGRSRRGCQPIGKGCRSFLCLTQGESEYRRADSSFWNTGGREEQLTWRIQVLRWCQNTWSFPAPNCPASFRYVFAHLSWRLRYQFPALLRPAFQQITLQSSCHFVQWPFQQRPPFLTGQRIRSTVLSHRPDLAHEIRRGASCKIRSGQAEIGLPQVSLKGNLILFLLRCQGALPHTWGCFQLPVVSFST